MVLADSGEATRQGALRAYQRYCEAIGARIPMIVFTGHRFTEEETQGLAKPFDIDELLTLIGEQVASGSTER